MLENPYYAAPSAMPTEAEAGAYQGAGRMEEAEDGSSISIWWESTLEDTINANFVLYDQIGTLKKVQKQKRALVLMGVGLILISVLIALIDVSIEAGASVFLAILGGLLLFLAWRFPRRFRNSVIKAITAQRRTTGTLEANILVEPNGVHHTCQDIETIMLWRSIKEIDVSHQGVAILREPTGVLFVPTRIYPDSESLERFVKLVQKYAQILP